MRKSGCFLLLILLLLFKDPSLLVAAPSLLVAAPAMKSMCQLYITDNTLLVVKSRSDGLLEPMVISNFLVAVLE